jgi:DNA-binding HxlR family transcriptional regulator
MPATTHQDATATDIEAALEVLSDEYACRLLAALEAGPMGAADLAETCNMSRATAYRRLERLAAIGFVTVEMAYDSDGHHRKQFRLALQELELEVGPDGLDGRVSIAEPAD